MKEASSIMWPNLFTNFRIASDEQAKMSIRVLKNSHFNNYY